VLNLIDMFSANRPLADKKDIRRLTEDGYRRNALVFACIVEIATSLREPPLYGYTLDANSEEVPLPQNHMLTQLLLRPGSRQSMSQFLLKYATQLEVAGNAYIYIERAGSGMPIGLRLLRPDACKAVPNENGEVYEYSYGISPSEQRITAEDVIHEIAYVDPIDPFYGLSPISVLSRMGDLDNNAADYLRAFFLNAGIPSGLLKYKEIVGKEERENVKRRWKEQYSAIKGWWDIGVLDGDV